MSWEDRMQSSREKQKAADEYNKKLPTAEVNPISNNETKKTNNEDGRIALERRSQLGFKNSSLNPTGNLKEQSRNQFTDIYKNVMEKAANFINKKNSDENKISDYGVLKYHENSNYIPQNSHEERLTGHLVSELENALFILQETFEQMSQEIYGQKVPVEFHYADLSSDNQEKNTGADLGLIFHVNLPDFPETFRVAAIQAKKMKDNGARIDIEQKKKLIEMYDGMAYYMFYDMTSEHSSPLIQNANSISMLDDEEKEQSSYTYKKDKIVDSWDGAIPLSVFLIFDMLNTYKRTEVQSIWEAKNLLLFGKNENSYSHFENRHLKPSKILTVSIGGISDIHKEYGSLSRLFRSEYPEE